jgi:hypothetical protein
MMSAKQHSRKQHIEPAIYAGGEYANHCIIEMFSVIFMTRTILYLNKSVIWIKKKQQKRSGNAMGYTDGSFEDYEWKFGLMDGSVGFSHVNPDV